MRKSLIITFLLVVFCTTLSNAQLENLVVKKFDTWGVGFHISANNPNGDATDGNTQFNTLSPKFGYGLTVSKQFSHFVGMEFDYAGGSLGTEYSPYQFTSKFNQITGRLRVNFTNGQILANYEKTQFYGFLGVGMIHYKSTTINHMGSQSDWVHVIPFGIGFKKKFGGRASMNMELGYNRVNTDLLDMVKVAGSSRDGYTDFRAGLQFTLGSKKKPLEWDEPLSYFKPSTEHSVDTIVIVKREIIESKPAVPETVKTLTLWYDTGDYMINGIYSQDIYSLLKQLKENPDSWIEVFAYCDSTGSQKVNDKLVLKRSRLVNDFFVNEGVSQERIKVYNYGMDFAKNSVMSKNRRVIIKYWKSQLEKPRQ